MCTEWQSDFVAFLKDMGQCPSKYTLERIDANGHYEPRNCRWATHKEQANNTRRNVYVTNAEGQKLSLKEACDRYGVSYYSVQKQRNGKGIPTVDAFRTAWGRRFQTTCPV